ncbi:RraA family protein [Youxingia wuxianensis]|uniref:Putative 4-hydroxy-4-methyl-2-oxoglutarate aldolase n=1 Tax=Youxingia wuxianensis TaxID=2763678 RepID=A0A926ICN0_9FIRM|nr:RraA family protein [Youxingia wuxianensis]MBC8585357.1 RraA family protein [Youxingia wuxianensis]
MNDKELFAWIKEHLYVPVVCDILDSLGYRNQAMHQRLRPLDENCCVFVGRARTFRWLETDYIVKENPYGKEIEAMDSLKENDVAIHSTDSAGTNAPWGELMSTAAKMRGAVGCVCDSQIRDCMRIKELGFPVFYTGIRPLDSQGRGLVVDYDVPVRCGDVLVNPGDLVYADFDGVVVVPKEVEAKVFELAREKANKENISRKELLEGKTLAEVYAKYGAL